MGVAVAQYVGEEIGPRPGADKTPPRHCRGTLEQGTNPLNVHMDPCRRLANGSGV